VQHTNATCISTCDTRKRDLDAWGSADFFRESSDISNARDRDQFNPKIGVTWTPRPGTTVRGAVFRVLRRTLPFTSQTIEPTQVAGFNQFYDDYGGTDAWTYGAGADQKITDTLFAGLEYSQRDLDVPISSLHLTVQRALPTVRLDRAPGAGLCQLDTRSAVGPFRRLPVRTTGTEGSQIKEVTTNRVPLSARFFHPSGLFAMATGTWFDQSGEFFRIGQAPTVDTPESGATSSGSSTHPPATGSPNGGGSFP